MSELLEELRVFAQDSLPGLIVAVAIIVVGWVLALLMAAITRRALNRTGFDEAISRSILGEERARGFNSARWAGRVMYYIILLLTAVAFLQATQLTAASEPIGGMLQSVLEFLPHLFAALAIGFAGWLTAKLARTILSTALGRWGMDRRLREQGVATERQAVSRRASEEDVESAQSDEERSEPVAGAIADAAYWLVLLLFVPAVLSALQLNGLLVPVQAMLNNALGFLPNIVSAIVIVGVGWLVARIVQRLIVNALGATGANRLSDRVGLSKVLGKQTISQLIGFVAYLLVLLPVAVGALNALQLDAITAPASSMLESFFAALPALFGAALILLVSYVVARLVAGSVSKLLNGMGFDRALSGIGVSDEVIAKRSPSDLVGGLVLVSVMYFAAMEAAKLMGFATVVVLGSSFAVLAGHVLLGLVIFGLALYLGKLAAVAIESSDISQRRVLGTAARIAVVVLGSAMALRQMGIADEIIELAFGLTFGGAAVAAALAFGLGGRDTASRVVEEMRERLSNEAEDRRRSGGAPPMAAGATAAPEREPER